MEKAILVGIQLSKARRADIEESLEELSRLAETAGVRPVQVVIQNRKKLDPATVVGAGKALELKEAAQKTGARALIFDEDLKPAQQKNLAEITGVKIVDRPQLILDIFAKRARSKEGILQVERARLEYFMPRITERYGRFEQQTGGIGTRRGPGEKKLAVEQSRLRDRIALLDKEIENIRFHRGILRQKRLDSGQPVVAIAGYTNAGKSTLLNTLSSGHEVYADNKLFATLDPTTRQVKLPGGRIALFTDTVGFIKKLPHALVAAFRATLEEITLSSCLVHVIDASQKDYEHQVKTVLKVLKELKAENIPSINVYNKSDLLTKEQKRKFSRAGGLLISARYGEGLKELLERIESIVVPRAYPHDMKIPYAGTKILGQIYKLAVVKKQEYLAKAVKLRIECTDEHWKMINKLIAADGGRE